MNAALTFLDPFAVGVVVTLVSTAALREKGAAVGTSAVPVSD